MTTQLQPLERPNLSLELDAGIAFDVRRYWVQEAVQELFEVTIEAVTTDCEVPLGHIIGQAAAFALRHSSGAAEPRCWSGIATIARQTGVDEAGLASYEIVIRPLLWALTQRRNYRIYQHLSDLGIALRLLDEWGIPHRDAVDLGAYTTRKFRVQYAESDYTFFCRLLEDAGVGFYFETEGAASRLVLDDAMASRVARPEAVSYVNNPNPQLAHEYVTGVTLEHRAIPSRYTQRDLDYRRAPSFPLVASAASDVPGILSRAERFHYVPGAFLARAPLAEGSPSADDRGAHRTDLAHGQRQAQARLDAKRSKSIEVTFRTSARDVRPGMLLSFRGHPRSDLGEQRTLLVTACKLSGEAVGSSSHEAVARGAEVPYRPALRSPKPKVPGVESATVVGPLGDEIHTDEFGRVRVHFHWDREGTFGDGDSCWVPVSQPWGGAGYGAVNLPRIGQEVLVEFLGGDPDRPVIIGRVYTGLQPVPYQLPSLKTQSGWKSFSSPATGGYNEIMFEDAAGGELMRVQAEKDRATLVKNDCSKTVGRNESKLVRQHRDVAVAGHESKLVNKSRSETVAESRSVAVGGDSVHQVMNDAINSVQRHVVEWNGGDRHLETGQKFVAKAGNSSSYFVMTEGFMILQSDKVFINPGLEATLAAIRDGTCPLTADEEAEAAAQAAAAAEAVRIERFDAAKQAFLENRDAAEWGDIEYAMIDQQAMRAPGLLGGPQPSLDPKIADYDRAVYTGGVGGVEDFISKWGGGQ